MANNSTTTANNSTNQPNNLPSPNVEQIVAASLQRMEQAVPTLIANALAPVHRDI
jgi:hypothetical protein